MLSRLYKHLRFCGQYSLSLYSSKSRYYLTLLVPRRYIIWNVTTSDSMYELNVIINN